MEIYWNKHRGRDVRRKKGPEPIRWGIIGCGVVTEVKSGPAYQKVKGFELTSVMRRNIAAAKSYAERHGVAHFSDNTDDIISSDHVENMRQHLLGKSVHPSTGSSAAHTGWVMDQVLAKG